MTAIIHIRVQEIETPEQVLVDREIGGAWARYTGRSGDRQIRVSVSKNYAVYNGRVERS